MQKGEGVKSVFQGDMQTGRLEEGGEGAGKGGNKDGIGAFRVRKCEG